MRRGFTLVELLITVIIIAVLASIAVPKFANASQVAKETAVRQDLQVLREAVENFKADTNRYPLKVEDLAAAQSPVSGYDREGEIQDLKAKRFKGPYLDRVPASAITGESYLIVLPPEKKKYVHHPHGTALDGSDYYEW